MSNTVPATFLGAPVLSILPNRVDQRQQTFDRRVVRFEVNTAGVDVRAQDDQPGGDHTLEFVCVSRAEVEEVEAFVEARLGSYEAFWFPTWQFEFELTAVAAGAVSFTDNGYLDRLYPSERWRYMSVLGPNLTGGYDMLAFEVQAGEATNTGMTSIGTVAAGGTGWATMPPDAVLMSRLCYGRLRADVLRTSWKTMDAAVITMELTEIRR